MTVFAGVDAGGSYTEAAVSDGTDRPYRHRDGPAVLQDENVTAVAAMVERSVRKAMSRSEFTSIDVLVVGIAGAGDPVARQKLQTHLITTQLAKSVHVIADAELHLEAAFARGPGIVVVGGTGSIAMARDAKGSIHRAGGYGYRFGDEGGGYDIGRAAIQAVLWAKDGRGPATILSDLLCLETDTSDENTFSLWTRHASRQSVAALAPVVMLAEQAGDLVAQRIIKDATRQLTKLALSLVPVFAGEQKITVALTGGLLHHDTPLRQHIMRRLRSKLPNIQLTQDSIDPVDGALQRAMTIGEGGD